MRRSWPNSFREFSRHQNEHHSVFDDTSTIRSRVLRTPLIQLVRMTSTFPEFRKRGMLRDKATQAAPAGRLTNSPTLRHQGARRKAVFVLIPYGDCHVSGILETKKNVRRGEPTVFRRRLCRPSKYKRAYRACVRSCARLWQHGGARARRHRRILCSFALAVAVFFS